MDALTAMRESWREWLAVYHELPENPLAHYFHMAERRRLARVSWLRKNPLVVLAIVVAAITLLYLLWEYYLNVIGAPRGTLFEDYGWHEIIVYGLLILALPIYAAWFMGGLFTAVGDSLGVLCLPDKRSTSLKLDDMIAVSALTDRQIVLAMLSIILSPLWLRVAVGAVLAWVFILVIALANTEWELSEDVAHVMLFAPLTVGAMAVAGVLASLAMVLYLFSLGRGINSSVLGAVSGVIIVMSNGLWVLYSVAYIVFLLMAGAPDERMGWPGGFMAVLLSLLVIALFWGGMLIARTKSWIRSSLATATPLFIPFLGIALGWGAYVISEEWFNSRGYVLIFNYLWSWGSFALFNPLAIPALGLPGVLGEARATLFMLEWYRLPLLFLLQAGLIAVFAHFARDAVARRRQTTL